jgi:glutathionylspermidine synthase
VKRVAIGARPDWREKAREAGFTFHEMHGEPYWEEETAYAFTLAEVEDGIEDPATELHAMCREAAAAIVASEELMARLEIPEAHRDFVADSWRRAEPELYGRFDLAYGGAEAGPAKLLEYNADTPTSLFETTSFQWAWLEDMIAASRLPDGADQFNGVYEALVERFREIAPPGADIHFTAFGELVEDYATVEMLAYAARDADLGAHFVDLPAIGLTDRGQFADAEGRVIGTLFKLYPWEDMLRDDFAEDLAGSECRFLEPPWKALLSNKGLLAVLWRLFPDHPNLLPAFFAEERNGDGVADALAGGVVTKPLFSREGASVTIERDGTVIERSENRAYDAHPSVLQAYVELPVFDGARPVVGAWVAGERCVGMGLREDRSRITQDLSRFKPHWIEP